MVQPKQGGFTVTAAIKKTQTTAQKSNEQNAPATPAPATEKTIKAKAADTSKELVTLKLPDTAKETKENFIVPAGPMGKERWFVKSKMAKVEIKAGVPHLTLTRGEVASRGLLDHIVN